MLPLLIVPILATLLGGCSTADWRTLSRESAGLSPTPQEHPEAIVQVFTARAISYRGWFGTHPWISWKGPNASTYSVTQVTAWGLRRDGSSVSTTNDTPDRYWFGAKPILLFQATGPVAEKIIVQLESLANTYRYKDRYSVWPGPNSNTYIAHLIREIPEIQISLPATSIGEDYLVSNPFVAKSSSGTGFIVSLGGFAAVTLGLKDGIELSLAGLNFGLDWWPPAINLPIIGRVGFDDQTKYLE